MVRLESAQDRVVASRRLGKEYGEDGSVIGQCAGSLPERHVTQVNERHFSHHLSPLSIIVSKPEMEISSTSSSGVCDSNDRHHVVRPDLDAEPGANLKVRESVDFGRLNQSRGATSVG
jgi:hypothetical protein